MRKVRTIERIGKIEVAMRKVRTIERIGKIEVAAINSRCFVDLPISSFAFRLTLPLVLLPTRLHQSHGEWF
jgi:hypothetical protein